MPRPRLPETLPGRLLLACCDIRSNRLDSRQVVGYLLRAGALTELLLAGRLVDSRGRASCLRAQATGDPFLDGVLREIAQERPRAWKAWVRRRPRPAVDEVVGGLEERGYLRRRREFALGVLPVERVVVEDGDTVTSLRRRVVEVLTGTEPVERVDALDAAMVSLLSAGSVTSVVPRRDKRQHKQRLAALTERSGEAAPALRTVLADIQVAVATGAAVAVHAS
ncbi:MULTISPECIES: GOLPH3/VPS74 family protein [Actinoalloteichus]|uniref:Golgi phosphoprotein 3 (GPP34) n=1 Tax=Actinoalloteichus caeruleus DSM 43889 TaxID=1120930 RepID=A0ABT1JD04_ACTCY|nr:GPP34 family phosphoprotein [Actinoalloteichus caeruleus]MCP2330372.1 Golgi phosphoprotein 3 (GPP34) [Actinoalloteichus caeruleus DSM 43889]